MPVVPRGELGRYVECRSCASTFEPDVLRNNGTDPHIEDMVTRILRRAVRAVLGSTDALSSDDRREAVIVLQRYSNVPYSSRDLDDDLAVVSREPLEAEVRTLAGALNEHGRQAALNAIVQLPTPTDARRVAREQVAAMVSFPHDRSRCTIDLREGEAAAPR